MLQELDIGCPPRGCVQPTAVHASAADCAPSECADERLAKGERPYEMGVTAVSAQVLAAMAMPSRSPRWPRSAAELRWISIQSRRDGSR